MTLNAFSNDPQLFNARTLRESDLLFLQMLHRDSLPAKSVAAHAGLKPRLVVVPPPQAVVSARPYVVRSGRDRRKFSRWLSQRWLDRVYLALAAGAAILLLLISR